MMRRLLSLLIVAGAIACDKGGNSSTVDLIKTVATEARLKTIEDRVEKARIGRLVSSGTEAGFMNVVVEVDNTATAISQLRKEAQEVGVLERSSFKVF
jgi:hypothetical protein